MTICCLGDCFNATLQQAFSLFASEGQEIFWSNNIHLLWVDAKILQIKNKKEF